MKDHLHSAASLPSPCIQSYLLFKLRDQILSNFKNGSGRNRKFLKTLAETDSNISQVVHFFGKRSTIRCNSAHLWSGFLMDRADSSSFAYNHPHNMVSLLWCGILLDEPAITNLNHIPTTVKPAHKNIHTFIAFYMNLHQWEKKE